MNLPKIKRASTSVRMSEREEGEEKERKQNKKLEKIEFHPPSTCNWLQCLRPTPRRLPQRFRSFSRFRRALHLRPANKSEITRNFSKHSVRDSTPYLIFRFRLHIRFLQSLLSLAHSWLTTPNTARAICNTDLFSPFPILLVSNHSRTNFGIISVHTRGSGLGKALARCGRISHAFGGLTITIRR